MTDTRAPRPDLVVLSDLHLGEGTSASPPRFAPTEDFFFDGEFCRLLQHLRWQYSHDPDRLVLVLNGDICDFLTVTNVPPAEQARALGIKLSAAEKRFGLNPTPTKSLYKLDRIIDGHEQFFAGLAQFVAAGFRVEILRGNHDLELHFRVVRHRLRERLSEMEGGPQPAAARRRVRFHEWFYLEPGRVYIEHGNQYEASNSIRYPLRPVLPARRSRREGEPILDYPLGSFFVRYFYNSIHRINPHTPKIASFEQYLEFLRRHNLLDLLRIARDHYPFFARAVQPGKPGGTTGPSSEGDSKQNEAFTALAESGDEPPIHRALSALKIHPLAASKAALVRQMIRPILRRITWVGGLSVVILYAWLLLFNLIQATPWLTDSVFVKAILMVIFAVGTGVGIVWLSNYLARSISRRSDETIGTCAERADQIARLTGAKLVLMGHTHVVDIRTIADGRSVYANSGTWTAVDNPWDRLHPDARRFTFLWVRGDEVSVCRWNDDAGRIDPVPLFDLPEARDLAPGTLGDLRPRSVTEERTVIP